MNQATATLLVGRRASRRRVSATSAWILKKLNLETRFDDAGQLKTGTAQNVDHLLKQLRICLMK